MGSGRWLVVAVAAIIMQSPSGVSASGGANELTFRPFDKTSIPLANGLPADVQGYDREVFSRLGQDEKHLIYCPWKDDELSVARGKARRGSTSDIYAPPGGYQYVTPGGISDQLNAHLMPWYFGKLDKDDLWISKYWSRSVLSGLQKAWPMVFRGRGREIFDFKTVPTEVSKSDLTTDFRWSGAALITDRIVNFFKDESVGTEGIVFLVNENFVKFKESYAAAGHYCNNFHRYGQVQVSGWRRICLTNAVRNRDMKFSSVADDSDTLVEIGFICQ